MLRSGMDDKVLRGTPLFAALEEDAAHELLKSMTNRHVGRGELLFRQGEPGDQLYVIVTGKVKLGRMSRDGRENLVAVLGPLDMFGELSLFDPGPRSMSASAVSDTRLLALSHRELNTWLDGRPEVAKVLLRELTKRLRRTNEALADLVFSDVPGRVSKALLDLARRFGTPVEGGLLVAHELTQEELAQLVGASRETVNKALADFAGRGWIRLEPRAVTLLDIDRLQRRAR